MAEPNLFARDPYELRVDQGKHVPDADVRAALASGAMGFLHSFTTGSAVDGPGIRVVAWTSGCMWRCLYCHNPDTWTMSHGIPVTLERAEEVLSGYRHGLKAMNGGLTISGGEPLMQQKFVLGVLNAARAMGIHTALDTNGYYGDKLSDNDLTAADLVLLDLKGFDGERHKRLTGMDNAPTLAFARRLAEKKRPVWVRFVLVPGLTDDAEDVKKIAAFAGSLGNVERVDVLPFHQMGQFKWKALGLDYKLGDVKPPPPEMVENAVAAFRAEGLTAY